MAKAFGALLLLLTGWIGNGCLADGNEYRLLKDLLINYDSSVRPVVNSTLPLQVIFGMSLYLIIDVDERNQILTTNCWLTQKWNDSHLTWNASDYGGIRVVRIPYQRVWRPDIILYNNADAQYSSSVINTNVIVSDNGEVVWLSHGIFRSSCDINVEFFPFDLQSCKMKWASWTYDGFQIDLQKQTDEGDMSNYQTNGEFDLIDFEAIRHEEFYSCCPEPYPDITYVIKMKRRPLFYVFNLILPCLLINGIALLVFYVPSESGEKVTLGISALLSMTVFLMTIRESLPPTEKTPLISLYYGVSICLVSFASGLSVVTLNLHHRGLRGTEVPYILRRIILGGLARLVLLKFDVNRRQSDGGGNPASGKESTSTGSSMPAVISAPSDLLVNSSGSLSTAATELVNCNCSSSSRNNVHRKGRPKVVVSATTASGWPTTGVEVFDRYSLPSNGLPAGGRAAHERLRLRIQDRYKENALEPSRSSTRMMYDMEPEDVDKYQSAEMDFLGLGPPSPLASRFSGISSGSCPHTQQRRMVTTDAGLDGQASSFMPKSTTVPTAGQSGPTSCSAFTESGVISSGSIMGSSICEQRLSQLMIRVSAAVERNESRLEEQDRREAIALEWKQLALVCDRILLLTFVIITAVATCVVLTSSPHGP